MIETKATFLTTTHNPVEYIAELKKIMTWKLFILITLKDLKLNYILGKKKHTRWGLDGDSIFISFLVVDLDEKLF